jgi:nicotinate-nucleotide pyrophosphorylase (carboxylating)
MIMSTLPPPHVISRQVQIALEEDQGSGDLTATLIAATACSTVTLICREAAVLCGTAWVNEVFRQLDARIHIHWNAHDGAAIAPDTVLCTLHGNTRALLTGERTALNFLQTLSGTATITRCYVEAVAGTGVRILDTRKTLPGLRLAQKYAVQCGGGANHRIGLFDAILIKENHIQAAGSIANALAAARRQSPDVEIEVEVESIDELRQALAAGAKRILLDNFELAGLHVAVHETAGRARLEASGGVDLDQVRAIAATGVNDISVGGITKHVRAVDLSLRFIDTI